MSTEELLQHWEEFKKESPELHDAYQFGRYLIDQSDYT